MFLSLYLFSQKKYFASSPNYDAKVRSFGATQLGFKDQILFLLTVVSMPATLNRLFVTLLGARLIFLGASIH
tara:strand:+ start:82 stop:297 length:216 start_codon:yes stop_codon:yes gene_type:complete